MNLAKHIDADIFAKQFINFGKQIIFLNSVAHKLGRFSYFGPILKANSRQFSNFQFCSH